MTSDNTVVPLKVVLLGDSGTGKTNLLARLLGNKFTKQWIPTSGVVMDTHHLLVDNDMVKTEIWDLGGREKYRTMVNSVLKDAAGILLVYDISNYATFENVTGWLKDIIQWADAKTVVMLVGNKSDLKHQRAVSMEEAGEWAAENGLFCVETSALDISNIKVTLEWMIEEIRATVNSVFDTGPFSTCSFIVNRIDSSSNDAQPFQIVLIDLKMAADDDDPIIRCVEKPLDDPDLKYVALSYRWGELEETNIDTQVGYTAIITSFHTANFYELCYNMSREVDLKHMDYVWVDAICIDQNNYERRKATIYHMSEIYERADYILAVPDLHAAYLGETSTLNRYAMAESGPFKLDLYYLIHGQTDQFALIEERWLDRYGVPHDPALRQSLKRDTDHFMDGLMTYREHHRSYNAEEVLDHIADHHHHHHQTAAATTNSPEEEAGPHDWRSDGEDASFAMERLHDCQQIDCPLDLSHHKLPEWREKRILKNGEHGNKTWKQLVVARSAQLRRSVRLMADLITDWSTRVWVISEYNIAKKNNNMKYWFTHLGDFITMKEFTFFKFDFTDTSLAARIEHAGILPNGGFWTTQSSEPPYLTLHQTMISQLTKQTFFEMMLKSKASRNEDRFYAIFPLGEYKNTISSKAVVSSWKIDTLVSVRLKLFELINTKDKLNLLFSSGNDTAGSLGEVLPTFATSSLDWIETMEHFTLDGKDSNHTHDYNFDLTSPSAVVLHYHPSDYHNPNLSDLPYLNLKPKEFYVVEYLEVQEHEEDGYSDWDLPATQQLWRLFEPEEPTLMLVCIPSWTQSAMNECNIIHSPIHVIYLAGDKKKNIWILEPTRGSVFVMPKFSTWTRCTLDDHRPGFNIY